MSGIFPNGGVPCDQAFNAACDIPTKNDCPSLFYSSKCQQKVDPSQINALISEIGEVLKKAGYAYDCKKFDNLASAVNAMIMKQDALTRTWVLQQLEALRTALERLIELEVDAAKEELNLRMDGLLFECLSKAFPASTGHTGLSAIGVGTKDGCTRIVKMPAVQPDDSGFAYKTISQLNLKTNWNTPVQNTSGKMQHLQVSGDGGSVSQGDNDNYPLLVVAISHNGNSWYEVGTNPVAKVGAVNFVYVSTPLPAGWFYRITGGAASRSGTITVFSQ